MQATASFPMRVIGGALRGRDLGTVPEGVRPTSDRVRESLFSILGPLRGKRVLDLFAGTGALGIESLSRGADYVVFVEQSRRTVRALRERLSRLDLDASIGGHSVLSGAADKAIRRLAKGQSESVPQRFDLVLMDPPYAEGDRTGTLETLFAADLLAAKARVVVEGPKRHPLPPVIGGRILDERVYGDTILTWLESTIQAEE